MAHSCCDSNHGWFSLGDVTGMDVEASSSDGGAPASVSGTDIGALSLGPRPSSMSPPGETTSGTELTSSPPSCFSHPVPVHTLHGRLLTTSSGARSRCAARDARILWIRSVINVKADGSKRIMTNVMMGLRQLYELISFRNDSRHDSRIPFPSRVFSSDNQCQRT